MDIEVLAKYEQAAIRAESWLLENTLSDGDIAGQPLDISAYYLLPYVLHDAGCTQLSERTLNALSGQLNTSTSNLLVSKTNEFLAHYPCIPYAWTAISAQKMGRFDISFDLLTRLRGFYHPDIGGFTSQAPYGQGDNSLDVYTTATLGYMALFFGDLNKASRAGNFILRCMSMQPDIQHGFFLKMHEDGRFITSFNEDKAEWYVINRQAEQQSLFMVGFVIGFLTKLYLATQEESFISGARSYFEYVKAGNKMIVAQQVLGFVPWGISILARASGEPELESYAIKLADDWLMVQNDIFGHVNDLGLEQGFYQMTHFAQGMREIIASLSSI